MHGSPVTAPQDGWNGSQAPAMIGSIARINRRVVPSAATAITRRTHCGGESDVFSPFAGDMLIIVAAEMVWRSPVVHRASATLAAARSAAFQERAPEAAGTAPEARAALVERQELG